MHAIQSVEDRGTISSAWFLSGILISWPSIRPTWPFLLGLCFSHLLNALFHYFVFVFPLLRLSLVLLFLFEFFFLWWKVPEGLEGMAPADGSAVGAAGDDFPPILDFDPNMLSRGTKLVCHSEEIRIVEPRLLGIVLIDGL